MQSQQFDIPEIGPLIIRKNARAKRIILKINAEGTPILTIPNVVSFHKGYTFALEKRNWIQQGIDKLKQNNTGRQAYGIGSTFKTRFTTLEIGTYRGLKLLTHKKEGKLYLLFPEMETISKESQQLIIKEFIINTLRKEAKEYLPARTKYLADQHGFQYKKVYIKNLKSRWGSCSAENNINLNLHLMRLPEYLSDFVILHELCHTIHKNHGPAFHALLQELAGDEKALNKKLNSYHIYI